MGQGTVQLRWGNASIALQDCFYVPDIVINLVSAGALDKKGCHLSSNGGNFTVRKEGVKVLGGKVSGNMFTIEKPTSIGSKLCVNLAQSVLTLQELHKTYGHASIPRIAPFIPNMVTVGDRNNFQCKACVSKKITKSSFKGILTQADKAFERIHLDLIGPITPQSCLHPQYILMVVENHTGYLVGFPLVKKEETTEVLIKLLENKNKSLGYYPL
jgi:hypothetical protein